MVSFSEKDNHCYWTFIEGTDKVVSYLPDNKGKAMEQSDTTKGFMILDEEEFVDIEAEMAAEQLAELRFMEACFELESQLASEGLRFTKPFHGAMPMQAYGWLRGERFYFRFRGDNASLLVGTVDPKKAKDDFNQRAGRFARAGMQADLRRETGDPDAIVPKDADIPAEVLALAIGKLNLTVETDFSVDAYPSVNVKQSTLQAVTGNRWAGFLNADEAKDVFIDLVSMLDK